MRAVHVPWENPAGPDREAPFWRREWPKQEEDEGSSLEKYGSAEPFGIASRSTLREPAPCDGACVLGGLDRRVHDLVQEPQMLPGAVAVSCSEMIRTGTTCFADQYFWMDQIIPEVRRSGLRAALAYGVVELGNEEARQRELAAGCRRRVRRLRRCPQG